MTPIMRSGVSASSRITRPTSFQPTGLAVWSNGPVPYAVGGNLAFKGGIDGKLNVVSVFGVDKP